MYVLSTWGSHKRVSDPLELDIRMVVSYNWCAGIWTQVPARTTTGSFLSRLKTLLCFRNWMEHPESKGELPHCYSRPITRTFFSFLSFELQHHILLLTLLFFSVFWDRSSLCYPGWSQIQSTWILKRGNTSVSLPPTLPLQSSQRLRFPTVPPQHYFT